MRLPQTVVAAYAPAMSDESFAVSIVAIGALTLALVGIGLLYF